MSRIGKSPISLPTGVTVTVEGQEVIVRGSKGELRVQILPGLKVEVADGVVTVSRKNELQQTKANHGLLRSLINNDVTGVAQGYKKTLKLVGTGYRVTKKGQGLSVAVGFSHPVEVTPLKGVLLEVDGNDTIYISGSNKRDVGQQAADIRAIRPPEPYQGKGIRFENEVVRRKQGKAAA